MDDIMEITVTINSDTFPLLWEYLNEIRVGRRRAGALKRAAENFLLLQKQSTQAVSTHKPDTESPTDMRSLSQNLQEDPADQAIDPIEVRGSLSQFGFGE
jgi:hypothetical protein